MPEPLELGTAVTAAQEFGELVGVSAFAVSGALLAVRKRYDIVGLVVLGLVTALGGGVMRDLIIGVSPPAAFTALRNLWLALATVGVIFLWHPPRRLTSTPLDIADAVGLGVFCVTGTATAYTHGLTAASSAVLGVVTAMGGGIARDLLAGVTPSVLRADQEMYAVPALLGSVATALLLGNGMFTPWTGSLAALGAIVLRLLALRFHWHAPRAQTTRRRPSNRR